MKRENEYKRLMNIYTDLMIDSMRQRQSGHIEESKESQKIAMDVYREALKKFGENIL